jgi:UDP-N-acetylmuramate--alanine ligase
MTSHFHIMGIAGAGMSAIAHLLLDQGHQVSGCDQQANSLSAELEARGATIMLGHAPEHLASAGTLVISSAVQPEHPEVQAALERRVPVLKRADLWHTWSEQKPTLAIAGTHGKTTTTAMTAIILERLGYNPAYIVPAGGPVPGLERFARWGSGPFVIEADEYDRLLLGLVPEVAIITNVDWDHVDIYPTRADVETTFTQFATQVRRAVVYCAEDPGARRVHAAAATHDVAWHSYGFGPDAGWRIADVAPGTDGTRFVLHVPADVNKGEPLSGRLQVPGNHNLLNATGAIAAVTQFGVDPRDALAVLGEEFRGAARRFELKGEEQGITFVDDYAHNPAKVAAALAAARMRFGSRRLVVYFQPHTFSRTAALLDSLAAAFNDTDLLLVGDIYPSRERAADFPGVNAALLVERIGVPVEAAGDVEAAAERLFEMIRPGDVVLTLGAGDGYKVGDKARAWLKARGTA